MAENDRSQILPRELLIEERESRNQSNASSPATSRPSSLDRDKQRHRAQHRVKFSVGGDDQDDEQPERPNKPIPHALSRPGGTNGVRKIDILDTDASTDVVEAGDLRAPDRTRKVDKERSAVSAQHRASRLASQMGAYSTPLSRENSVEDLNVSPNESLPIHHHKNAKGALPLGFDDIPLVELDKGHASRRPYSLYEDSTDEDSQDENDHDEEDHGEADRLVRSWTGKLRLHRDRLETTGDNTPAGRKDPETYVPPPKEYKTGVLSSLLKLYDQQGAGSALQKSIGGRSDREALLPKKHHEQHPRRPQKERQSMLVGSGSQSETPGSSSGRSSGTASPRRQRWYEKDAANRSTGSVANLLAASSLSAASPARPDLPRTRSSGMISAAVHKITHAKQPKPKLEDQIAIRVHIAEVLSRQEYIIKLCKALMIYGAPTHRLEEYLKTSARALQIHGQFLYLPGAMIVSFDDPDTHTTHVKVVKENQGVDLGRFKDVFNIYKEVR